MLTKLGLYINTIQSMKASQIYYRIRKILKLDCSIGCKVSGDLNAVRPIATVPELDFDSMFLERFSVEEFIIGMENGILRMSRRYGTLIYTILNIFFQLLKLI